MYPKQHPVMSQNQTKDIKRQQQREQLTALLLNKFRNKFSINMISERDLDVQIRERVAALVSGGDGLSEKKLAQLDQQLSQIVRDARGGISNPRASARNKSQGGISSAGQQIVARPDRSSRGEDDVFSNCSRTSKAISIASSRRPLQHQTTPGHVDISDLKLVLGDGKHVGMSEDQWNQIVQKNVKAQRDEENRKKEQTIKQRQYLKDELQMQVNQRKAEMRACNDQERELQSQQVIELDQRRQAEERKVEEKKMQLLKSGADAGQQLMDLTNKKRMEAYKKVQDQTNERRQLDAKLREQDEADRKKRLEKMNALREIVDIDKYEKRTFRQEMQNIDRSPQPEQNIMTKLFERKTHQAFERRAKNDEVVGYISNKFVTDEGAVARRNRQTQQYLEEQLKKEQNDEVARIHRRKQEEYAMKCELDLQVNRKKGEKSLGKEETLAFAKQVNSDVDAFNYEQHQKKRDQLKKNQIHQTQVEKQIDQRNRLRQYTGAQVLVK